MTIVANHSSLSPAMRAALTSASPADAPKPTVDALVARGYLAMTGEHIRHLALTPAGKKARAVLINGETPAPLKVARWLGKAEKLGLSAETLEAPIGQRAWRIYNPAPLDPYELWIYHAPGSNGGRLTIMHFRGAQPFGSSVKRRLVKVTGKTAASILIVMGESLERHRQRQARAARAEGADVALAQDLGLTVEELRQLTDPSRPGWLRLGQVIRDRSGVWHQVTKLAERGRSSRLPAVAVSTAGGYGGEWQYYGDHPEAVGTLDDLDRGAGRPNDDRRAWPRSLRAAHTAIGQLLIDQVLEGWAAGRTAGSYGGRELPDHIVVNIPDGVDPLRALVLIHRYVPYDAEVVLAERNRKPHGRTAWPMIFIYPRST